MIDILNSPNKAIMKLGFLVVICIALSCSDTNDKRDDSLAETNFLTDSLDHEQVDSIDQSSLTAIDTLKIDSVNEVTIDSVKVDSIFASIDSVPVENIENPDLSIELPSYHLYYKSVVRPVVFKDETKLYAEKDTGSEVVQILNFNTPFVPVKHSSVGAWTQVEQDGDTAFVQTKDIALYSFPSSKDKRIYYFITEKFESVFIHKYDLSQKRPIDTFEVKYFLLSDFSYINASQWENVSFIVSLRHYGACCGCSDDQIYVMEANGKFEVIFETSQAQDDGEEGGGYETNVYLPADPQTKEIVYTEYESYGEGEAKSLKKRYQWDGKELIEILD